MVIEIGSLKITKSHIIIFALMIMVCFLLIDRSCNKKPDPLEQALKDLKAEKENSKTIQKKADSAIANYEELKKESDSKIMTLIASLAGINSDIRDKDSRIAELETALPGLQDKDEIIANQAEQISEWKGKFSLAQKKISDLGEPFEEDGKIVYPPGSITFELNRKYEAQLKITGQWEAKFGAVCAERDAADKALNGALRDLRNERLRSKAKTGALAAAAGGALYLSGEKIPAYIAWAVGLLNLIF